MVIFLPINYQTDLRVLLAEYTLKKNEFRQLKVNQWIFHSLSSSVLFCPACIISLHQQPISEKLDPSIRKFVVKERVLFMHNVVDEESDNDFIVTTPTAPEE